MNQPTGHVRLLRDAKLDAQQLSDPSGRIPLSAVACLSRSLATRVPDPAVGLRLGADVRVREFGIVGYALAFSSTLQRQLRGEGTKVAALLTEHRREMAPSLLRDGRLGVSEVAFLLGYEDPSAFRRAFRRWFGRSPRAYRDTRGAQ